MISYFHRMLLGSQVSSQSLYISVESVICHGLGPVCQNLLTVVVAYGQIVYLSFYYKMWAIGGFSVYW